jgi:hypothetical protein
MTLISPARAAAGAVPVSGSYYRPLPAEVEAGTAPAMQAHPHLAMQPHCPCNAAPLPPPVDTPLDTFLTDPASRPRRGAFCAFTFRWICPLQSRARVGVRDRVRDLAGEYASQTAPLLTFLSLRLCGDSVLLRRHKNIHTKLLLS